MLYVWILTIIISFMYITYKYDKGYLYAFCLWYSILPNNFGIQIISTLPLISVDRILIILVTLLYLYKNSGVIFIKGINKDKVFLGYFILITFALLGNIATGYSDINELLSFIIEHTFLIILLFCMMDSKENAVNCFKFILVGGCFIAIIGIIQCISGYNIAKCLFNTKEYHELATRLGLTRASSTMAGAITFGYFNIFLIPLSLYFHKVTHEFKYILYTTLFMVAAICSLTRGAVWVLILLLAYVLGKKIFNTKKIMKKGIIQFVLVVFIILFVSMIVVLYDITIIDKITSIFKMLINTFNTNFKDSELSNSRASASRLEQLSVFKWLVMKGRILFGYGANAIENGLISYFRGGSWKIATAMDTGYAGMLASGGILKLTGYSIMFIYFFLSFRKEIKLNKNDELAQMLFLIIILLLVSNLTSLFYADNLCVIYYAMFYAFVYKWKDSEKSNN